MLGWGLLSENGDQPSVLQKAKVPFLPYGGDHLSDDHGDNPGAHGDYVFFVGIIIDVKVRMILVIMVIILVILVIMILVILVISVIRVFLGDDRGDSHIIRKSLSLF